MGLSAPRRKIFFLSLLLVGIGIFARYNYIPFFTSNAFWLVVAAYTVLATGAMFKGI